jgi:fructose-1-phosphate kinase PfkB-like protein
LDTTGEALRLGCQEGVFLVKPNAEETHQLTGMAVDTPVEIALAAAEIRKMGAQNVVISLGKMGALLQTAETTWMAYSPTIKEKNPIGAGDSMVGGLGAGTGARAQRRPRVGDGVRRGHREYEWDGSGNPPPD